MGLTAALPVITGLFGGGGGGGLGGLLGGGGTKVKQNVSQTSNNSFGLSITNLTGTGTTGPSSASAPVSQSPSLSANDTQGSSPSPVYGQTFGPDYTPGDFQSDLSKPQEASFPPILLIGAAVFVFFMMAGNEEKK